jgi:hypothetical protein
MDANPENQLENPVSPAQTAGQPPKFYKNPGVATVLSFFFYGHWADLRWADWQRYIVYPVIWNLDSPYVCGYRIRYHAYLMDTGDRRRKQVGKAH